MTSHGDAPAAQTSTSRLECNEPPSEAAELGDPTTQCQALTLCKDIGDAVRGTQPSVQGCTVKELRTQRERSQGVWSDADGGERRWGTCTQGPGQKPHCLCCRRISPPAPSLPAWAHPAQEPNLVSFALGKTALGSASALDSLQWTGSDLPNWEDRGRNWACHIRPPYFLLTGARVPAVCPAFFLLHPAKDTQAVVGKAAAAPRMNGVAVIGGAFQQFFLPSSH